MKGVLPAWRYRAAIPFAALTLIAAIVFWTSAHAISNQRCADQNNAVCTSKPPDKGGFTGFVHANREDIEAVAASVGAFAAILLVFVTAGLWGATNRLADSTEDLAKGADAQAREQHAATEVAREANETAEEQLHLATEADILANKAHELAQNQFLLTGRQADLAERQHGLQREQFYAQYRPELKIQFIRRLPPDPNFPPDEQDITVEFTIANIGTAEANVIGSLVRLDWMERSEIPTPNELTGGDVIPHRRFLVGATDTAKVSSGKEVGLIEALANEGGLYLLGWVVYADGRGEEFGSKRTTYFLRRYDPVSGEFEKWAHASHWDWETTQ